MKPLPLLVFLLVAGITSSFSQTCHTVSTVPVGQPMLARGRVILDNDGVVALSGGQAVYARIINQSNADLSYIVVVEILDQDTKKYATDCIYKAKLVPKGSAVVWESSAKEAPVPWRVGVTIGPESDGDERIAGLSFEVYSNAPKNDSQKQ